MKQINAPLLFMVFNRLEKTNQVWQQIRKAKPKKLYVSSDGPRQSHPDDFNKIQLVRKIVSDINWECDVKYLFHENNLGCSLAGKTAFDWVFSQEDRMMQLEDDTVPSLSYFWFMDEMLEKYRNNDKIGYVTGQNFMGITSGNYSYFFSHYGGSSGWGTWKRIYEQWDYYISEFYKYAYNKDFKDNFDNSFEYSYWLRLFESFKEKMGNTYDLQSVFLVFKNDLYNIVPNRNLITNIGFDSQGANYNGGDEKFANKDRFELDKIIHPQEIVRNKNIDKLIFNYHFLNRSKLSYSIRWKLGPLYRKYIK